MRWRYSVSTAPKPPRFCSSGCGAQLAKQNRTGICSTCSHKGSTIYIPSARGKPTAYVPKRLCDECYADRLPGSRLCGKPECAAKAARNKAAKNKRGRSYAGGPPLPSWGFGGGKR